jgi:hypothetical protein
MLRTLLLALLFCAPALARDNGQFNRASPDIWQWFRDQKSPKTGMICCTEADGNEGGYPRWSLLDHVAERVADLVSGS